MVNAEIKEVFQRINDDRREAEHKRELTDQKLDAIQKEIQQLAVAVASIPGHVSEAIKDCQRHQDTKRRWGVGTLLSAGLAVASLVVAIFAIYY